MADLFFDEEVDPDTITEGGFERAMPGKYHMQLAKFAVNEKGSNEYTFTVLAGKPNNPQHGDQRGRQVKLYVSQEFKPMPRKYLGQLALVLGLVTIEDARKAKEERRGIEINWEDGVGRHCGAIISEEEYNGEMRARIQWPNHLFSLDSPEAQGMPIDRAAIEATDDPFSNPPASDQATTSQAAPTQQSTPASAGSMFD